MKILFDHQIYSVQKYGGISRYFFELFKQFNNIEGINYELALLYTGNSYILNNPEIINVLKDEKTDKFCCGMNFKGKDIIHRKLSQMRLARHPYILNKRYSIENLKKNDFDLFHPTYYDPYFYKYLNNKPIVLTVYDMIHELYSGIFFHQNNSILRYKKYLIEKADKIIAISENTKNDLIRLYGLNENKIDVVYLGSSLNTQVYKKTNKLYNRYILFVGDRPFYKNFEFFLKSISPLFHDDKDLYLICGGSKPFNKKEYYLFEELNISKKVIHKNIQDDSTLVNLYRNALCFVFPSLYEGFGIPILESFSCGCPIVLSNTSSLSEVGGEAAFYFDPEDPKSIIESVKSVVYDSTIRDRLRQKGYEQLKKFSWKSCALDTKKVYESVLK